MHIDVIIPTVNRPLLLRQTCNSLMASTHKDLGVFIVVDGNKELLNMVASWKTAVLFNSKRRDWIFSINRALQYARGDAVIYASDDLVFDPHCIERAAAHMVAVAPDLDAVVAITQDVKGCSTAFGMLGRTFIERFPGREVFCPDYVHYASDFELGRFARSVGKLFICDDAKVTHRRPKDQTYRLAKPVERRDVSLMQARRAKGLLWGQSTERLT